jgi:hypothetical protein
MQRRRRAGAAEMDDNALRYVEPRTARARPRGANGGTAVCEETTSGERRLRLRGFCGPCLERLLLRVAEERPQPVRCAAARASQAIWRSASCPAVGAASICCRVRRRRSQTMEAALIAASDLAHGAERGRCGGRLGEAWRCWRVRRGAARGHAGRSSGAAHTDGVPARQTRATARAAPRRSISGRSAAHDVRVVPGRVAAAALVLCRPASSGALPTAAAACCAGNSSSAAPCRMLLSCPASCCIRCRPGARVAWARDAPRSAAAGRRAAAEARRALSAAPLAAPPFIYA